MQKTTLMDLPGATVIIATQNAVPNIRPSGYEADGPAVLQEGSSKQPLRMVDLFSTWNSTQRILRRGILNGT